MVGRLLARLEMHLWLSLNCGTLVLHYHRLLGRYYDLSVGLLCNYNRLGRLGRSLLLVSSTGLVLHLSNSWLLLLRWLVGSLGFCLSGRLGLLLGRHSGLLVHF